MLRIFDDPVLAPVHVTDYVERPVVELDLDWLCSRGLGVKRERREPREERLQLEHRRMLGAEGPVELLHAMPDDPRVRARRDGQERVVVADAKAAALALKPELSRVEHDAVRSAEDGQQHPARELALHRVPVDVERDGVP